MAARYRSDGKFSSVDKLTDLSERGRRSRRVPLFPGGKRIEPIGRVQRCEGVRITVQVVTAARQTAITQMRSVTG